MARWAIPVLILLAISPWAAQAETLRIATYNPDLSRKGPGLLLRDIQSGRDKQIAAVIQTLVALDADILVLTSFDYDHDQVALNAFADALAKAGLPYAHRFSRRPNTGMQTGLDLDGDGRPGGPGDAQGFGFFAGQEGLAVLSRHAFDLDGFRDFSTFLWRDLPGNLMGDSVLPAARPIQRLSSSAHWDLPVRLPGGRNLHLLIWHATPPVFDGPEDRNGRRNHDETAFWLRLLDGALPMAPPPAPFVILGDANLDPMDGDGRNGAMTMLLQDQRLTDPEPKAGHDRLEAHHDGNPALDTAIFDETGGLRVDYVLPSADLKLSGAGVLWPADTLPLAQTLSEASRHRPVWVDIILPLP